MKLLVTGGAGFIGSNFIHYILEKYSDYRVVNLDLLTYCGNLENLKDVENDPRYKFVKGDICDVDLVNNLVKNCDAVIHFAAESHVDRSILDPGPFVRTNVLGTLALLNAARNNNNKRFHHVSTDEVFGSLGPTGYFNENTPYDPGSPYSASKAASDHFVRAYFHTYKLPITITNCSNNYGEYEFPEKLIPLFVTNLLEGKNVPLYGDGLNVRDWLYVIDHCEAIDVVLHKGKIGETYCVGGNEEKTNLEITYKILEILGFGKDKIEFVADRKGHDRRYAIDATKIKKELGWGPKYKFDSALKQTVAWYKTHEAWWQRIKSGEYLKYYEAQYGKK
ncbi:dTDP-glucose 4,6-dehydratase [Patescibacteria group bacterium AH-259-L07]|nr:dTDP-glucose 4,6-dehydratase [Patescibacteria group bacterium AH-259-L07]